MFDWLPDIDFSGLAGSAWEGIKDFGVGAGDFIGLDGSFGFDNGVTNASNFSVGNLGSAFDKFYTKGNVVDANNNVTGNKYLDFAQAAVPATFNYLAQDRANDIAQQSADLANKQFGLAESQYYANLEKEKEAQNALANGWLAAQNNNTTQVG